MSENWPVSLDEFVSVNSTIQACRRHSDFIDENNDKNGSFTECFTKIFKRILGCANEGR